MTTRPKGLPHSQRPKRTIRSQNLEQKDRRGFRQKLKDMDVAPRKSMGQNFLQDDKVAQTIAQTANIQPHETVLEIGPGTGAVTQHLIGRGQHLILIEKDAKLVAHQRQLWADRRDITIIEADAAEIDLRPFFRCGPIVVVGNLPYSVGTTILTRWLENPSPVGRAIFMLQKEVCDRLCARPRSKEYGQLTVRIQARWHIDFVQLVPPNSFHPQPKVDSGIIALQRRPPTERPVYDDRLLQRWVRIGFAQRRKLLKKNFPVQLPVPWESLITQLKVPATIRAEELSVEQWIEISRLFDQHPLKDQAQSGEEIFDVVDEKNQIIGQECRTIVHEKNLRHRAVHVFVINRRHELLLQYRSHLKDKHPSTWDSSAAGHLDAGETYEQATLRELKEECGISRLDQPPRRIGTIDACANTGWEFVELYLVNSDGPYHAPAAEIEALECFPLPLIDRWVASRPQDFAPGFIRCYQLWRSQSASPSSEISAS